MLFKITIVWFLMGGIGVAKLNVSTIDRCSNIGTELVEEAKERGIVARFRCDVSTNHPVAKKSQALAGLEI